MDNFREIITIGKQCFENRDFTRAEEYFKKVVTSGIKYADVFNMLGVISHAKGKFGSAIDFFREALDLNPRYTEAVLNLAVLYNDLGQYEDAKKLYKSLKQAKGPVLGNIEPVLRGKLSNLHADIGDIYRSIGMYGLAIDEYRKALNLNPAYFDIRTKLGQALREHGLFKESLSELYEVLKAKPSYCPALVQQGVTLYAMDRINEAKKSWQEALKKDPENRYAKMYIRLCDATGSSKKSILLKPTKAKKVVSKSKKTFSKKKTAKKRKRK